MIDRHAHRAEVISLKGDKESPSATTAIGDATRTAIW
jgi:hypothetical protein